MSTFEATIPMVRCDAIISPPNPHGKIWRKCCTTAREKDCAALGWGLGAGVSVCPACRELYERASRAGGEAE